MDSKNIALLAVFAIIIFLIWFVVFRKKKAKLVLFPEAWKKILTDYVAFYRNLNDNESLHFQKRILDFLNETKISGVKCDIGDLERLLVAASAIIPVFSFEDWEYELNEVLIYDGSFDGNYQTDGEGNNILGMVGGGAMHRMMILSKPALIQGFGNARDKKNVGIHEFVHLIDKADGVIDGIPSLLLENQYSIPWLELIRKKIDEIYEDSSDINPYGATGKEEFYAVVSEYFFERPHLLKSKHPEVYKVLSEAYNTNLTAKYPKGKKKRKIIGRNSPCPCGSGQKYKRCCLSKS